MIRILALMLFPMVAMAQVEQGPPNADFKPAFPGQTRIDALPKTPVSSEVFAEGLDTPWGIAALPSGQFLVTERTGNMRVIDADGTVSAPISGLPDVVASGQGGLLDVAISPTYSTDRFVYWTYSKPVRGVAVTAAARGVLSQTGQMEQVQDIFVQNTASNKGQHFGSRIIPNADGTVWITTGDANTREGLILTQRVNGLYGKVIRVNSDGSLPTDNPFADVDGAGAVWSLGHRNMQGAAIDADGRLWTIEHGPRGGDELNLPQPGRNYGWPVITYGVNYNDAPWGKGIAVQDGMEQPIYYWDPVIAPAGMMFYDGPYADWQGDLLIASLTPGGLVRLKISGDRVIGEERLISGRMRDVEVLDDGSVLVLIDRGADSPILRVTPG